MSNVSADLIWEITRKWFSSVFGASCTVSDEFALAGSQNAFLVKRKTGGSPQFSRDPFNLTNVHSRKVRVEEGKFWEGMLG